MYCWWIIRIPDASAEVEVNLLILGCLHTSAASESILSAEVRCNAAMR